MPDGKLKFENGEVGLSSGIITCGRATDNSISFPDDSNVSRYHAEIEERDGEYWLIDLGSSNGTALNGQTVTRDTLLCDGDAILLGGSSKIDVRLGDEPVESEEQGAESGGIGSSSGEGGGMSSFQTGSPGGGTLLSDLSGAGSGTGSSVGSSVGGAGASAASAAPAASNTTLLVAGVVGGLALVCVVAAGAFYFTRGSSCTATARISKPEPGEVITQPVEIEVEAENTECVDHAVFTLDGTQVAVAKGQPFTARLDPKEFPDLADGFDHNLQIVLIDAKGEMIPQTGSVLLAFDTKKIKKVEPTPGPVQTGTPGPPVKKGSATIVDIQQMSTVILKRFPASANYSASNPQFLQAMQKATAEYAQDGYFQKASGVRDAINVAYVQEQNLDASIGFILAMSRSKYNPAKQGANEGLWQMASDFVAANGYNGSCGNESLSDPSQKCAARASALYMKSLIFSVFDGDVIYSAAAFGKSPADAGVWKATLPQNRADIWNSIKTAPERDQLVRFFAAAIVAENPQKFGLTKDQPLSQLYVK